MSLKFSFPKARHSDMTTGQSLVGALSNDPFLPGYYYYKNELTHQSTVIISDYLNHDVITIYLYSVVIIDFIIRFLLSEVHKLFFFPDGAPQQYKNHKHSTNLFCYKEDYGMNVERNFFDIISYFCCNFKFKQLTKYIHNVS